MMNSLKKITLLMGSIFICCSNESNFRFPNGSVVLSKTYELNIDDTSKIISTINNLYVLNSFSDSQCTRIDTLWYNESRDNRYKKIFGRIDQEVIHSRNREITELYRFENSGVYLVGYVSSDTTRAYVKFEPAIIVYPHRDTKKDSTVSKMIVLSSDGSVNGEAVRVQSLLEVSNRHKIEVNGEEEDCVVYILTIKQDAVVQYGEHGLIVPEAIVLVSTLLIGNKSGLIAEWGIRQKLQKEDNAKEQNDVTTYVEVNYYSQTK